MKHSIVFKFLAILLAACALTVAVSSALGVVFLAEQGLYRQSYEQWHKSRYENLANGLSSAMAESYAARKLSNFSRDELTIINWGNTPETIGAWWSVAMEDWRYQVEFDGTVMESNYTSDFSHTMYFDFQISARYPMKVSSYAAWDEMLVGFDDNGTQRAFYCQYHQSPEYTVKIWLGSVSLNRFTGVRTQAYELLYPCRYYFVAVFAGSLLVAAALLVYLCCAAGKRRSGDAPQPGGMNRLPLDIYAAAVFFACLGAAALTATILEEFLFYTSTVHPVWLTVPAAVILAAALLVVGLIFALAAQWKMGDYYVWKHSLLGFLCGKLWKGLCYAGRGLRKLFALLPLVWRYLLIGLAMGLVPLWFFYLAAVGESFWVFFLILACLGDLAIILYGAYAYGTVIKGAGQMAAGELHTKINTQYLLGANKDCAENLNVLADVATVAAQKQMKSERMKTELITNVSHDIKTPLTSIINYIDLLQKAETPEQTAEYLQVLDRQSQRIKKLIDDLMEMSKAASGNLSVDITRVDAAEAVNQALGEFADKLTAKDLNVVFSQPEKPVLIQADGRLTWRVLSNLLSNIVKYALPGTRVYVDMRQLENAVEISLKNISKEPLNVSADELTERFVRGDASRNTEGSGLGLNIAQSLMERQKGRLDLLVDGDLFKVTLTFPTAN